MSEPRTDPLRGDSQEPDPAHPVRPPSAPELAVPSPPPADSADVLDNHAPPTDDAPTVISKNPRPPSTAEVSTNNDLRGRRLAHFELIEQIGVGGMAAVLRARDTQLDRDVALKILPPDLALDGENIRRFHQEARNAAKLDHENIARVFFCGEDQRLHFIAFEFVEGENLRTILERRGRLPVSEALPYLIQVTAGLSHAAQRGVVHRDIKPSNIIITPNGRAKLVDMGLARSLEPQNDKGLTQSGVTLGTFDYISPEQALEPRDADVRSDIYSLGCTFYHMVTGRPPVPEGTAARKLHHHQHVKPVDPRELVPGLPDEVAFILDRMMAKNPRDRYQSADELLRHLLAVAKKLGATIDVPEGVLFVEATLPTPPGSSKPWLLGALAIAAVVFLIFFVDLTGPPPENPVSQWDKKKVEDKGGQPQPPSIPAEQRRDQQPAQPTPSEEPRVAHFDSEGDPAALAAFLNQNKDKERIEVVLSKDLELKTSAKSTGGLLAMASKGVIFRAKDRLTKPVIRLTYEGTKVETSDLWTALTIKSPEVLIEGIRFEINAKGSAARMTALRLDHPEKGVPSQRVARCEFLQAWPVSAGQDNPPPAMEPQPPATDSQLVSVDVESGNTATFSECVFVSYAEADKDGLPLLGKTTRRLEALVGHGSAALTVEQCAFGPHGCLVRLADGTRVAGRRLTLTHCSVLADNQTVVVEVGENVKASLNIRACLFSKPDSLAEGEGGILVRQKSDRQAGDVTFNGSDNRYHNFKTFWSYESGDEIPFPLPGLDRKLDLPPDSNDKSSILDSSPWKDSLVELLVKQEFYSAFQLDEPPLALRLGRGLIGVERLVGRSYLTSLKEPPPPNPIPARKERIVDPTKDDSTHLIYRTLQAAVLASNPGDVILIRASGLLSIAPLRLEKSDIDLTIRPERNSRPVLSIDKDTRDRDAALFRLHDGKIRLEDLEFRLQPLQKYDSQTVVALLGDGQCTFKSCLITLDQTRQPATALSAVRVCEQDSVMKMDSMPGRPPNQGPKIFLENCFVRGQGDLLWSRSYRPFELDTHNVLAALSGSFLNLEVGTETATAPSTGAVVRLNQVTTYLGGALISWKGARDIKAVMPVQWGPNGCAFLPQASSSALLRVDSRDIDLDKLRGVLTWGAGDNVCGTFTTLLDQPGSGELLQQPLKDEKWRQFTGGDVRSKARVTLAMNPAPDQKLTDATPAQFKLDDPPDFGIETAPLEKLMPADSGSR